MTAGVALIPFSASWRAPGAGPDAGTAWPALAQTAIPAPLPSPRPPSATPAADLDDDTPVDFAADEVEYANDPMSSPPGQCLAAARGTDGARRYDHVEPQDRRDPGQGNIRMVDDDGNIVYTDKADRPRN
jgi:LPS-assembly protein